MAQLEQLIENLCPNGVEYKNLQDILNIQRGVRVVKNQLNSTGKYPVYQNSLTPMGYHTDGNFPANTTFIIGAGAAGEVGYSDVNRFETLCNNVSEGLPPEIEGRRKQYEYYRDKLLTFKELTT